MIRFYLSVVAFFVVCGICWFGLLGIYLWAVSP